MRAGKFNMTKTEKIKETKSELLKSIKKLEKLIKKTTKNTAFEEKFEILKLAYLANRKIYEIILIADKL